MADPDAPTLAAGATPDLPKLDIPAMVRAEAVRQGRDPDLVERLARKESSFDPEATSKKGAFGIMQLMPDTALKLGVDRYDLADNIKGGVTYLGQQIDHFGGDKRLGVAAYNAGPANVTKYGDVPPFKETQDYVDFILGKGQGAPRPDPDAPSLKGGAEPIADVDPNAPSLKGGVVPAPTFMERLGNAAARAADAPAGLASKAVSAAAQDAHFEGNPDSPISHALAQRSQAADQTIADALAHLGHKGAYAPPRDLGAAAAAGPEQAIDTLTGLGELAGGAFGKVAAPFQAFLDPTIGQWVEKATAGLPSGALPRDPRTGLQPDYDLRLPRTFAGDYLANVTPFAEHTPEAALAAGDGSVVNAKTNEPLTAAQTAFYKTWDHDKPLPPAQVKPGEIPPAGEWYVSVEGRLQQSPPELKTEGAPHPLKPPPEPAPATAPAEAPAAETPAAELPPVNPEAPAATPAPTDLEPPFGAQPTIAPAEPNAAADTLDQALNALRDERSSKPMNGPRLSDMLIKAGGLKDDGGELAAMDIKGYGARGGRLLNKSKGLTLSRAAELAQEQGYIGRPVQATIGENDYATPADLMLALHNDLAGGGVYSRLHEPRADAELRELMRNLHEELAARDISLSHDNATVRQLLRDAHLEDDLHAWEAEQARGQGEPSDVSQFDTGGKVFGVKDPDQPVLPGFAPRDETAEVLAQAQKAKDAARGPRLGPRDEGPLFDETAKAQKGLFGVQDAERPVTVRSPAQTRSARLALIDQGLSVKAADAMLQARPGEVMPLRDKPVGEPVPRAGAGKAERGAAASVPELIAQLARETDTTHRQGRMTRPEPATQGQYNPASGVARTRGWGQIDYASHEIGHHVETRAQAGGAARASKTLTPSLRKAVDAHEAELIPLDYVHDRPAAAAEKARGQAERRRGREYAKRDEKAAQKRDPLLPQPKVDQTARDASIKAAGDKAAAKAEAQAKAVAKKEGFAEFFRQYVTNRDAAQRNAPKFFKAFEGALKTDNPKMLSGIQKVSDAYMAHLAAPAADRLGAAIHTTIDHKGPLGRFIEKAGKVGAGEAVKAMWLKLAGDFSDPAAEFAHAQRMMQKVHWENSGKALDLEGRANPLLVLRTVRTAAADGFANLWHGVRFAGETKASGPSLKGALEHAYGKDWRGANRADFSTYLIARRLSDEWDRFRQGKLRNLPSVERGPAIAQAIRDLETQHPTFRDAAQMFSDYAKAEMKLDVQAGLKSQEDYDALNAERPFYAPINRVREAGSSSGAAALGDVGEQGARGGSYSQTQGSFRDFLDPVEVMMRRAMTQATVRRFNMAVTSLKSAIDMVAETGPGGGRWFERVPDKEIEAHNVAMEDVLAATAKKYGVDKEDLRDLLQAAEIDIHPAESLTFFNAVGTKARGENMVFGWQGGKRFAIRLEDGEGGALALEFMAALEKDVQDAITQAAGKMTGLLRFGVTGAPAWALTNAMKDAFDVWYKVPGALPFVTTVSGLADVLRRSDVAREYERFGRIKGGVMADAFEHSRYRPDQKLLKSGVPVLQHFASFKALAKLAEYSELATRVGVYKLARRQALKRGLDGESAAISASNVAADYMPFDVAGRKTASVRKWVPFLNAWQKGMATLLQTAVPGTPLHKLATGEALTRTDKEALYKSGRYAFLVAVVPTLLSAWQEGAYADDPEFRNINPYIRATNWVIKAEDLGLDKLAPTWRGKWIRVPKTFEHTAPADVGERLFEATRPDHPERADKRALGTIPGELWTVLGPPSTVAFISPYLEQEKNRDFNGKPIIPEHLMGAGDPELKVNSYTSDFAKALSHEMGQLTAALTGKKLTFSPAMADHWITAVGGTQARDLLAESSRGFAAARGQQQPTLGPEDEFITSRFAFSPARSSQAGADFWNRLGQDRGTYSAAVNDFNTLERAHPEQAIAELRKQPPDVADYVLAKKFGSLVAPGAPGGASALHPMVQAQNMVTAISQVRQEIRAGAVANLQGSIALTPDQRKAADDALSHLEMAGMHDALILSHVPQYADEKLIGVSADRDALAKVDPGLLRRLDEEAMARKIPSQAQVETFWPKLQASLHAVAAEYLPQATQAAATRGVRGKYDELIRQNEALLAH